MIIVSNTGPLIGLAKIQQLGLLNHLARAVYIPPQVNLELFGRTGPETPLITAAIGSTLYSLILISPLCVPCALCG